MSTHRHKQTEKTLQGIQAVSALLFLPFLVVHLSNTLLAIAGVDAYDGFQQKAQQLYQQPVVEIILVILPLLAHIAAGVTLHLKRRSRGVRRAKRLHSVAGAFLAIMVLGHAISTRGLPYFNSFEAGFAGVAFSLWWMPAVFYPYYLALFMAGAFHGINGTTILCGRLLGRQMHFGGNTAALLMGIIGFLACLALASFGGRMYEIADPRDNAFAKLYSEIYGIDLNIADE